MQSTGESWELKYCSLFTSNVILQLIKKKLEITNMEITTPFVRYYQTLTGTAS